MPIYEYRCNSCGHELEAIQKFSDPVLTDCPACSEPALKKLISVAGFQLKGTGWYATDFKGGPKKQPDTEKTAAKSDSSGDGGETKKVQAGDSGGETKKVQVGDSGGEKKQDRGNDGGDAKKASGSGGDSRGCAN